MLSNFTSSFALHFSSFVFPHRFDRSLTFLLRRLPRERERGREREREREKEIGRDIRKEKEYQEKYKFLFFTPFPPFVLDHFFLASFFPPFSFFTLFFLPFSFSSPSHFNLPPPPLYHLCCLFDLSLPCRDRFIGRCLTLIRSPWHRRGLIGCLSPIALLLLYGGREGGEEK